MNLQLTASHLGKVFNRRPIFREISFSLQGGGTLLICGRNGSGKSTLAKIIADVLTPTTGEVLLATGGKEIRGGRSRSIGMVAPYLQLYEEFSARENLGLSRALRGLRADEARSAMLLEMVGLRGREDDLVRTFSSGMKQRVKYAMALVHDPPVLLFDEPMANLDADGAGIVRGIMREHQERGILIVATNDVRDVDGHDVRVDLDASR